MCSVSEKFVDDSAISHSWCAFPCVWWSFFIVIALFSLELSVRTIRAPTWCWIPLEKLSKLTTNLDAYLIIFYACGFSIHTESINVGHKLHSVHKDWLVMMNSQGDLFFLIPRVKLWQALSFKFPYSPFLGWGLFIIYSSTLESQLCLGLY